MQKDYVEFVFYKPLPISTIMTDAYQYKPEVGYAWLQRIIFKFLTRIKAFAVREDLNYKRVIFKKGDLLEKLLEQKYMIRDIIDKNVSQVLIGKKEFFELLHIAHDKHPGFITPMSMTLSGSLRGGEEKVMMFGFEMVVIPWMEGMVVLPPKDSIKFTG